MRKGGGLGQLCWGGGVRDRKGGGGFGVEPSFHAASPPRCVCVCLYCKHAARPPRCVCVCVCTVDMPPPRRDQTKKAKKTKLLNSFYTAYVYPTIPRYMLNTIFFIKNPIT